PARRCAWSCALISMHSTSGARRRMLAFNSASAYPGTSACMPCSVASTATCAGCAVAASGSGATATADWAHTSNHASRYRIHHLDRHRPVRECAADHRAATAPEVMPTTEPCHAMDFRSPAMNGERKTRLHRALKRSRTGRRQAAAFTPFRRVPPHTRADPPRKQTDGHAQARDRTPRPTDEEDRHRHARDHRPARHDREPAAVYAVRHLRRRTRVVL